MWAEDHDRLDSVIDAVTREMTAGTPGAEFRARVLARIREPQSLWRSRWVLLPLAATAIVLLAVALYDGRPIHRDAASPAARSGTRQPGGSSVPAESTTAVNRSAASEAPPAPSSHRGAGASAGERGAAPRVRATPSSSELDELAPPPIAVDSIAVDPLAIPDPLTVQHLEISSIALTPIDDGDRQ